MVGVDALVDHGVGFENDARIFQVDSTGEATVHQLGGIVVRYDDVIAVGPDGTAATVRRPVGYLIGDVATTPAHS